MNPHLPRSFPFLGGFFPVAAVAADVPDREDVFRVADADLDVRFAINPTPFPRSPFSGGSQNRAVEPAAKPIDYQHQTTHAYPDQP